MFIGAEQRQRPLRDDAIERHPIGLESGGIEIDRHDPLLGTGGAVRSHAGMHQRRDRGNVQRLVAETAVIELRRTDHRVAMGIDDAGQQRRTVHVLDQRAIALEFQHLRERTHRQQAPIGDCHGLGTGIVRVLGQDARMGDDQVRVTRVHRCREHARPHRRDP